MSEYCEEYCDLYQEKTIKARKPHVCDACKLAIGKGSFYRRAVTIWEGTAETTKRCGACQVTFSHLVELCRRQNEGYSPQARLDCGKSYEEEWGPCPDEIARLAFLTEEERGRLLEER